MSTDERIEEPAATSAPIPKDGHYWAEVVCDTGGIMNLAVQVQGGRLLSATGNETSMIVRAFMEMSLVESIRVWPEQAALEIETLRTANAALMESVRDRERERDYANDVTESVIADNKRLTEKVKRLEEAGDEMASWLRNPRNLGDDPFMADQWEAAKGQP